jgi:hypothetical protein
VTRGEDIDNLKRFYRIDGTQAQPDYARGEGLAESSDEETDQGIESASDSAGEDALHLTKNGPRLPNASLPHLDDIQAAELDAQVNAYAAQEEDSPTPVDATSRFAIVNLDWDHVKASDLFRIISSVLTQDGSGFSSQALLSLRVYPSEFGKERLQREEQEGPPPEVFTKPLSGDEDGFDELVPQQGSADYDEESLRMYQLERLRYVLRLEDFASRFDSHSGITMQLRLLPPRKPVRMPMKSSTGQSWRDQPMSLTSAMFRLICPSLTVVGELQE